MRPGVVVQGFERLGLDRDATPRDLRRAYARELKKIDQAADAAGFQQLRDAYEAALDFAEWQAGQGAEEQETATAPAAPPPPLLLPASPEQLADTMADELCATLAQLAVRQVGTSDAPWRAALEHALADERLFGIEARHGFELRVAVILVRGWRPGHEALLVAAAAVFHWAGGLRLAGLGHAGVVLARALDERALFDSQGPSTQEAQRRVLALLRQQQPARDAQIAQGNPAFERMQERFPHWLPIVAPREHIAYWQERSPQVTVVDDPLARPLPVLPEPEKSRWLKPLLAVLVCLLAVVIGSDMSQHRAVPWPVTGHLQPPASPEVPPTQARMDEIRSRVVYKPEKGEARIAREVRYDVFLDVDGKAFGTNLVHGSGSPALDAAVKAAILGSAPFPPNTRKIFWYSVTYQPGVRSKRPR